jgi:hypothetical protein
VRPPVCGVCCMWPHTVRRCSLHMEEAAREHVAEIQQVEERIGEIKSQH